MKLQRYHLSPDEEEGGYWELEDDTGDWIKYEDVAKLLKEIKREDLL
jgi:hypothetical protein